MKKRVTSSKKDASDPAFSEGGKKRGRLSLFERRYIADQYDKKTPIEIAAHLNRSVRPIFNYLDKQIPSWRDHSPYFDVTRHLTHPTKEDEYNHTKEFHRKALELSKLADMPYADAKKAIRKEESVAVQTIDDLESLKESLHSQSRFITKLVSEIAENTEYWKKAAVEWAAAELTAQRRDLEIQRSQLHGEAMKKHSMPLPPEPTMTAGEFVQTELIQAITLLSISSRKTNERVCFQKFRFLR